MVGDEHFLCARELLAVGLRLLGERAHQQQNILAHEPSSPAPEASSAQQLLDGVRTALVQRLVERPEVVLLQQLLQLLETGGLEEVVERKNVGRLARQLQVGQFLRLKQKTELD